VPPPRLSGCTQIELPLDAWSIVRMGANFVSVLMGSGVTGNRLHFRRVEGLIITGR